MCKLQGLEQHAFFDCFLCLTEEDPSTALRYKGLKADKLKKLESGNSYVLISE